jgi:hypothetical protein
MGFGRRLHTLWRLRIGVAVAFLIAVLVAVWSVARISVSPPGLTSRSLTIATASTQLVVDTPKSSLLDLRQDTYSFEGLRNRAVLLGNVMASSPVKDQIARRTGIPPEILQVAAPRTPDQPRAVVGTSKGRKATDIFDSNDEYRLSIQANPTVPVLTVFASTPKARSSETLANAAVDSLKLHMEQLAQTERTPQRDQIRLMQLGRARGAVINGGVSYQAAILAFLLTFAVCCATALFIARVLSGWRMAALSESASF